MEGVLLLLGGVLAIAFPLAAAVAIETVLAVIALVIGGAAMARAAHRLDPRDQFGGAKTNTFFERKKLYHEYESR